MKGVRTFMSHTEEQDEELLRNAAKAIQKMNEKEAKAKSRDIAFMKFIGKYGNWSQMDICIEEMSELTKALLKYKRGFNSACGLGSPSKITQEELRELEDAVVDEIADVRIMCRQMELIFLMGDRVEERIDFKIERQLRRMEGATV